LEPFGIRIYSHYRLLALPFTFVATIQGFLAAGSGRLKASRAAVGGHDSTATTRLAWTEPRFRTTVEVPILTVKAILEGYTKANVWEGNAVSQNGRRRRLSRQLPFLKFSRQHPSGAGTFWERVLFGGHVSASGRVDLMKRTSPVL
jgi:hypothetical protein